MKLTRLREFRGIRTTGRGGGGGRKGREFSFDRIDDSHLPGTWSHRGRENLREGSGSLVLFFFSPL